MTVGGDFPVCGGKKARKVFLVFFCWERNPSPGAGFRNYARAVAPVRRERRPSTVPKCVLCGQSRVTVEERLARRNVTGMEDRPRAWESRAVPFVEDWLSGAICDVTGGVVRVFQVG